MGGRLLRFLPFSPSYIRGSLESRTSNLLVLSSLSLVKGDRLHLYLSDRVMRCSLKVYCPGPDTMDNGADVETLPCQTHEVHAIISIAHKSHTPTSQNRLEKNRKKKLNWGKTKQKNSLLPPPLRVYDGLGLVQVSYVRQFPRIRITGGGGVGMVIGSEYLSKRHLVPGVAG
ncbi:hypothetical protein HOY80DRAFT_307738 [Tuber brumale]|nr:hypothetical protein HOY80DRAFT_307738 [Tuber brumale]